MIMAVVFVVMLMTYKLQHGTANCNTLKNALWVMLCVVIRLGANADAGD